MHGLWNVPTQVADHDGTGMIIWTLIVLLALSYPVGLASSKVWRASSEPWPGAHTVAIGMIVCFL